LLTTVQAVHTIACLTEPLSVVTSLYFCSYRPHHSRGTVSPDTIMYNGDALPATISVMKRNSTFDFYSTFALAAYRNNLTVTYTGYKNNTIVAYNRTLVLNATGPPAKYTFNWTGLTNLTFASVNGTGTPAGYKSSKYQFLMDNMRILPPAV
jgi:hypothetical protein